MEVQEEEVLEQVPLVQYRDLCETDQGFQDEGIEDLYADDDIQVRRSLHCFVVK